jgi:hypothetical protein
MPVRELIEGVTQAEFRALANLLGWTADDLAQRFKGRFVGVTAYFEHLLRADRRTDDTVIPFRCVIELYITMTRRPLANVTEPIVIRRCACGCGSAAWAGRRYVAPTCQQRGPAAQLSLDGDVNRLGLARSLDDLRFAGAPEALATRDIASERVVGPEPLPTSMSRVPASRTDPLCEECGEGFPWSGKGPRPRYCGARCRKRAERRRLRGSEEHRCA